MKVYAVEELVPNPNRLPNDDIRYDRLTSYVLGENLADVADQLDEHARITSVVEVCTVSELPGSKYKIVPLHEVLDPESDAFVPLGLLDGVEDKLKDVKHRLVHKRDFENAALVREVQSTIRTLKGEPRTLDELRASTECGEPDARDLAKEVLLQYAATQKNIMLYEAKKHLDDESLGFSPMQVQSILSEMVENDRTLVRVYEGGQTSAYALRQPDEEYCTDGCHTWYRKKDFCVCKTCGKPVKLPDGASTECEEGR